MRDTNMSDEWIKAQWARNPCVKLSNGDVRTGPVRLSFAFPHKLPPEKPGITQKYGSTLLFPPGVDISALKKDAADAANAKWPTMPRGLKSPFLSQDEDADRYAGYEVGGVLIRSTANQPVPVVNASLAPVVEDSRIYSGVWAIVTLRAFAYDKGVNKGVSFGLQNVMLVADDTNIGGTAAAKPSEAFAGVEITPGDIDADRAFGGEAVDPFA